MLPFPVANEFLFFNIPAAKRQEIIEWVFSADQAFMQDQLNRRGMINVIRMKTLPEFAQLKEMPARGGDFTPYYGMVGGAYRFHFTALPADVLLRVEHVDGERIAFPAYETLLGEPLHFALAEESASKWFLNRLEILMEDPHRDYQFYIDGEMYANLLASGWSKEETTNYRYEFVPLTVGCVMVVHHIPSGTNVDLTANVDW